MAGNLNYHPAPGLSELLPGFYTVPQNPIAMAAYGIGYTRGIGEIMEGYYTVPQNPVKAYVTGSVKPLGQSGCGCSGGCGHKGQINGMGVVGDLTADFNALSSDFNAGNISAALSQPILSVPLWGWLAGLGILLFAGGEKHSYAGRARRSYRAAAGAF